MNGLLEAGTTVPLPVVKPTGPYSMSHAVAPPVVQARVTDDVDVAVDVGTEGAGHDGALSTEKSSMAMSPPGKKPGGFLVATHLKVTLSLA